MARLTDTDLKRLVGALRGEMQPAASPPAETPRVDAPRVDAPVTADRAQAHSPEIARVSGAVAAAIEDGTLADAIGRAILPRPGAEIARSA